MKNSCHLIALHSFLAMVNDNLQDSQTNCMLCVFGLSCLSSSMPVFQHSSLDLEKGRERAGTRRLNELMDGSSDQYLSDNRSVKTSEGVRAFLI